LADSRRQNLRSTSPPAIYQTVSLGAEDLIGFDELRARIAELEETRTLAERELRSLEQRRKQVQQLEQDKQALLTHYAGLVSDDLDGLDAAQRRQVYGMLRVEAAIGPDGSLEVRGDVISISSMEILSA
jgi:Tfp pilus assembly protein PilN